MQNNLEFNNIDNSINKSDSIYINNIQEKECLYNKIDSELNDQNNNTDVVNAISLFSYNINKS